MTKHDDIMILFTSFPYCFWGCNSDLLVDKLYSSKYKIVESTFLSATLDHSHKKREDSLETRAEMTVLLTYVENQAIPEPILLYRASKYRQTKEQGSEDCLWTHIFTFL